MEYLGYVAATIVIIVVVVALMGLGWRNRLRRQADVPAPPEVPSDVGRVLYEAEGQYVATTTAGDWLDRIAVHDLGIRGNAVARVHPDGIHLDRTGARPVWIPRGDLESVQLAGGMAGKFVEKEGLVVITWRYGQAERVDTGFRTRHAVHKAQLVAAVAALLPDGLHTPPTGDPNRMRRPTNDNTPPTPEGREQQ